MPAKKEIKTLGRLDDLKLEVVFVDGRIARVTA